MINASKLPKTLKITLVLLGATVGVVAATSFVKGEGLDNLTLFPTGPIFAADTETLPETPAQKRLTELKAAGALLLEHAQQKEKGLDTTDLNARVFQMCESMTRGYIADLGKAGYEGFLVKTTEEGLCAACSKHPATTLLDLLRRRNALTNVVKKEY